jgi:hypothetical protein
MRHIITFAQTNNTMPYGRHAYIMQYLRKLKTGIDTLYLDAPLYEDMLEFFPTTFYGDPYYDSRFGRVIIKQLPDELQQLV